MPGIDDGRDSVAPAEDGVRPAVAPTVEAELRARLGIPENAERVLVFTESAHWDPDWLLTSKGYFRLLVRRNLDRAFDSLIEEPRRIYSAECAFFVRMYWEHRADRQDALRDLLNSGRLRLMGSGVTTPDTLIPSTESLLRDYLVGQEWYRANGVSAEPAVAYFPDSFGHSPALPSVMRAAGISQVAVCRIDGQFFLGCETELPGRFPRPGTSAELLLKEHKTQDFVWRAPDGSEVLAHWVAHGYGMGELLAHAGATRVAGAPLAIPWRSDAHVARRVERYARVLTKTARTPYLLCPIGFDFSAPIPRLLDLLDRYNAFRFPETGTWTVNAGLDDYLALVGCHRSSLPTIEFDPNPYFCGFYTSRRTVKASSRSLADLLVSTEAQAVATGDPAEMRRVREEIAPAWWVSATSNHHDFITGTAPDRVVRREQLPWLEQQRAAVAKIAAGLGERARSPWASPVPPDRWTGAAEDGGVRKGSTVIVTTSAGTATFDEALGGALVSLIDTEGNALVGGPALDVLSYEDWGGLWRMGFEFAGGRFARRGAASESTAALEIAEQSSGLALSCGQKVERAPLTRRMCFTREPVSGLPMVDLEFECTVPDDRSLILRLPLAAPAPFLDTEVPGGVVRRAPRNWFDPTFWNLQGFAHVLDTRGRGVALLTDLPGAVALRESPPCLDVVLARNATKERYLGFLPIPGFPARGRDPGPHRVRMAFVFTASGDWRDNRVDAMARRFRTERAKELSGEQRNESRPGDIVIVDDEAVEIAALKPADRGEGVVVRLIAVAGGQRRVRLTWPGRTLAGARLCDARERDLDDLPVDGDSTIVPLRYSIESVRLLV